MVELNVLFIFFWLCPYQGANIRNVDTFACAVCVLSS